MDYSSNLSDCKPFLEIEVLDDKQVKNRLIAIKKQIPEGYKKGISFLDACLLSIKKFEQCKNYKARNKKLIVDIEQSAQTQKVILKLKTFKSYQIEGKDGLKNY